MKSKLTTALTLLLALVFVVSSFAGCANGGEGTESGSASGSDATDSGSETSEIANAKEELGKVDWGGKEFGHPAVRRLFRRSQGGGRRCGQGGRKLSGHQRCRVHA